MSVPGSVWNGSSRCAWVRKVVVVIWHGTGHLAGKAWFYRVGEWIGWACMGEERIGPERFGLVRNGPKGRYGLVTVGCDGVWPGAPWIGLVGLVFGMVRFGKLRMGLAGWASASSGSVWKALVRHASTHWN